MRATRSRPLRADAGTGSGTSSATPGPDPRPGAPGRSRRTILRSCAVVAVAATTTPILGATAHAAPAPCGGIPQITDRKGDGHHRNTDVTAAWFSEQAGRLQAVIQVDQGIWEPAHDDSDAAGFALLYRDGATVRYVRAEAPRGAAPRYDVGTWTRAGGFTSRGTTTGVVTTGTGGTATIDVPASAGAVAGRRLAGPFVLTYDGGEGSDRHWVDRAPGGVSPDTTETGADHVVGSCGAAGATPGGGSGSGSSGGPGSGPLAPVAGAGTTSLSLDVAERVTGSRTLKVSGRAAPGRRGVPVTVTVAGRRTRTARATTATSGAWSLRIPVAETSTVRAVADGIGSRTATVTVRSTIRIAKVARRKGRRYVLTGRVSPSLPGRVLLLRGDAVRATKTVKARRGRFTARLTRPRRGRYTAVFIPSGERAERSISKTKTIR